MKRKHRLVRVNVWLTSIALAVELLVSLLQPWELVAVASQAVLTLAAWLNWLDRRGIQRVPLPASATGRRAAVVDLGPLSAVNPRTGSSRIAAYPAGRSPDGVCPVCGQDDPDGLDRDGCHDLCVEWLGYVPRPPAFGVTTAEAGAALAAVFAPRSIRRDRSPWTVGGYESGDRTIHDLPPFPAAMTRRRPEPSSAELRAQVTKGGHRAVPSSDAPGKPVPPHGPGSARSAR